MPINVLPATQENWRLAAKLLRAGKLVVFPTDTVYGIGCDAGNPGVIAQIYAAKGRSILKAIPLLLSGVEALPAVARNVPDPAQVLARRYWPGALTMVVERQQSLPAELGGGDTIAVRVPDHAALREFIRDCGGYIAATSANISGQPDALDAQAAAQYFGDAVALVIDGGRAAGGIPSTVVDCTLTPPAILREGAVPATSLRETLNATHC